jgi:nitroreductase
MRYIAIEIGHTGQNIQLQAVALGLGSGLVGAFKDEAVSDLLDLKKDESPYYLIPVGYKK